jgi:phosphoserine phosphatase RsbU/P
MSQDELKQLKKMIAELEAELKIKSSEVIVYRQELQKFSQKLDRLMMQTTNDTQLLSKIQKALVPTEIPRIPGFEISRKFVYGTQSGGDYFDIFEHEDKFRFGILVASSSGYAMSALFLSLILKVSHVLEAKKGNAPEKVLQQMAEELKSLAGPQDFTNAFYAVIDRRDYSFKFCSAGHVEGFFMTSGKVIQRLKSEFSPISQQFSGQLSSAQIELEAKSRIVIITDGLFNVLGADQVAQIMTDNCKGGVHDLRNELLFQAQRISGLQEPLRDQTVVVIEVKDQVIKLAK